MKCSACMRIVSILTLTFCLFGLAYAAEDKTDQSGKTSEKAVTTAQKPKPTEPSAQLKSKDSLDPASAKLSSNPAATPQNAMNFIDAIQNANEKFNQKDIRGCVEVLKGLYGKNAEVSPPYIYLAQWTANNNDRDRFLTSLELSAFEYPQDPEAFLLLGEVSLQAKQYTAAGLLLDKGAELIEKYPTSYRKKTLSALLLRNRIHLAEFRLEFDRILVLIDDYLKLEPNNAELYRQKGTVLFRQKKEDEARAAFQKADELAKNAKTKGIPMEAAMSQLYLVQGDLGQSAAELNKAIEKYPDSKEVLALATVHRIRENRIQEADTFAQKLLKLDPNSPEPKRLTARLELFKENYPRAEKLFQELILKAPTDSGSINGLALALCEQNDSEKMNRALEYARENVRRSENNTEYLGTLAWILFKANKFEEANQMLAKAVSGREYNLTNIYYLARIGLQAGKKAEAIELLENILKKDVPFPKRAEADRILGELKNNKK